MVMTIIGLKVTVIKTWVAIVLLLLLLVLLGRSVVNSCVTFSLVTVGQLLLFFS